MRICSLDGDAQRHAATICQHRPLGAQLASIRRVFPGFFPRPAELSSSCSRGLTKSTECPVGDRTPAVLASRVAETRDVWSTPESSDAGCSRNRIAAGRPSRDNPCASRSKCHPQPAVRRGLDARLWDWVASAESVSSCVSRSARATSISWQCRFSWQYPP
jgi:hypothetical protein